MAAVTICSDFGAQKIKSDTVSTVSPSISHEVMGPDAMIFVFWMMSFKPTFSLSSFTFIKRLFSSSSLSAVRVVSSAYLRLLIFLYTLVWNKNLNGAWMGSLCSCLILIWPLLPSANLAHYAPCSLAQCLNLNTFLAVQPRCSPTFLIGDTGCATKLSTCLFKFCHALFHAVLRHLS